MQYIIKQISSYSKTTILFLLFISVLFTSCGKDKTIEKIIYGDPITNGDNNGNNGNNGDNGYIGDNRILKKENFNSIAISREFNSIDDFYNYMKQCYTNKTNLLGIKFKIRGSFNLRDQLSYYNNDYYSYKYFSTQTDTSIKPYLYLSVSFINTDINTTVSNIGEITFIVQSVYYYYDAQYININGYSYL